MKSIDRETRRARMTRFVEHADNDLEEIRLLIEKYDNAEYSGSLSEQRRLLQSAYIPAGRMRQSATSAIKLCVAADADIERYCRGLVALSGEIQQAYIQECGLDMARVRKIGAGLRLLNRKILLHTAQAVSVTLSKHDSFIAQLKRVGALDLAERLNGDDLEIARCLAAMRDFLFAETQANNHALTTDSKAL